MPTDPEPTAVVQMPPPAHTDPYLAMIELAIANKMGAAELEHLMRLAEHAAAYKSLQAYNAAMTACQGEMPRVVFNAENKHTNSSYANLEAVNTLVVPVYTKHGFSLVFDTAESPLPDHVRVLCDVSHDGGHVSRKSLDLALDGKGVKGNSNMTPLQGRGSTLTYARRYLTCMIFNITVGAEDNDGNTVQPPITEEHLYQLNDLIRDCQEAGNPVNVPAFLKWLDVKLLSELCDSEFEKARFELARKLKQKNGGAK